MAVLYILYHQPSQPPYCFPPRDRLLTDTGSYNRRAPYGPKSSWWVGCYYLVIQASFSSAATHAHSILDILDGKGHWFRTQANLITHLDIKPVELDLGESHGPVMRCVRGSFQARPGNMDRGPASSVLPSGLSLQLLLLAKSSD